MFKCYDEEQVYAHKKHCIGINIATRNLFVFCIC